MLKDNIHVGGVIVMIYSDLDTTTRARLSQYEISLGRSTKGMRLRQDCPVPTDSAVYFCFV